MLSVLVAIRDFLLVMALAWVGITVKQRVANPDAGDCAQCQTQRDR